MKPTLPLLLGSLLIAAPLLAQARTNYICVINGKAAYTTEKINNTCQVSEMDGISDEKATQSEVIGKSLLDNSPILFGSSDDDFGQAPANDSDQIGKIWQKDQFGSYDDVKIMPRTADAPVSGKPAALDVKLRNQPVRTGKAPVIAPNIRNMRTPAPVIAPPSQPAKPQLSRKQILQREIANEQAALIRATAQLAKAQKSGGDIKSLQQTVRDRQANIKAIQSELSHF